MSLFPKAELEEVIYASSTHTLTLYKYITPTALKGLLEYGDFKLTYASDANDLNELKYIDKKTGKIHVYEHLGFLSMSKHSNHEALWGNYADKHRGACIEVKIPYFYIVGESTPKSLGEKIEKNACSRLRRKGMDVYCFCYGRYDDGENKIDLRGGDFIMECYYNDALYVHQGGYSSAQKFYQDMWRLVSRKHTDWSYEKEYRIVIRPERRSRVSVDFPPMFFSDAITRFITKIILGPHCDMTPADVESITNVKREKLTDKEKEAYIPKNVKIIKGKTKDGIITFSDSEK